MNYSVRTGNRKQRGGILQIPPRCFEPSPHQKVIGSVIRYDGRAFQCAQYVVAKPAPTHGQPFQASRRARIADFALLLGDDHGRGYPDPRGCSELEAILSPELGLRRCPAPPLRLAPPGAAPCPEERQDRDRPRSRAEFLPETRAVRDAQLEVAPTPDDLLDRGSRSPDLRPQDGHQRDNPGPGSSWPTWRMPRRRHGATSSTVRGTSTTRCAARSPFRTRMGASTH